MEGHTVKLKTGWFTAYEVLGHTTNVFGKEKKKYSAEQLKSLLISWGIFKIKLTVIK